MIEALGIIGDTAGQRFSILTFGSSPKLHIRKERLQPCFRKISREYKHESYYLIRVLFRLFVVSLPFGVQHSFLIRHRS